MINSGLSMDRDVRAGPTVQNIKEIGKTETSKEPENFCMQTKTFTKVNLLMEKLMGMVLISSKAVKHMKDFGLTINLMGKESKYLQISLFLKVNLKMAKKKAMAPINGMINHFTPVNG